MNEPDTGRRRQFGLHLALPGALHRRGHRARQYRRLRRHSHHRGGSLWLLLHCHLLLHHHHLLLHHLHLHLWVGSLLHSVSSWEIPTCTHHPHLRHRKLLLLRLRRWDGRGGRKVGPAPLCVLGLHWCASLLEEASHHVRRARIDTDQKILRGKAG